MSVIYEFVNTINNKVYVGQTKDFKSRIRCHRHNSKSYKKTIKKYGSDHHPITVRVKNNTRKKRV